MTILRQIYSYELSTLPVITRHLRYSADDGVARCQSRSCTCG